MLAILMQSFGGAWCCREAEGEGVAKPDLEKGQCTRSCFLHGLWPVSAVTWLLYLCSVLRTCALSLVHTAKTMPKPREKLRRRVDRHALTFSSPHLLPAAFCVAGD